MQQVFAHVAQRCRGEEGCDEMRLIAPKLLECPARQHVMKRYFRKRALDRQNAQSGAAR